MTEKSFAFACLLAGCALGEGTIEEVDPASLPPVVTWDEHIAPLLDRYCATCHSEATDFGAAEGYDYGSLAGAICGFEGLEETLFEEVSMPPGAAPWPDGRQEALLRRWRAQGFPERLDAQGRGVRPGAFNCADFDDDSDEGDDD